MKSFLCFLFVLVVLVLVLVVVLYVFALILFFFFAAGSEPKKQKKQPKSFVAILVVSFCGDTNTKRSVWKVHFQFTKSARRARFLSSLCKKIVYTSRFVRVILVAVKSNSSISGGGT